MAFLFENPAAFHHNLKGFFSIHIIVKWYLLLYRGKWGMILSNYLPRARI